MIQKWARGLRLDASNATTDASCGAIAASDHANRRSQVGFTCRVRHVRLLPLAEHPHHVFTQQFSDRPFAHAGLQEGVREKRQALAGRRGGGSE